MHVDRRLVLKAGSGLGFWAWASAVGLVEPMTAFAGEGEPSWNKAAFEAKKLEEVLKAYGVAAATEAKEIEMSAPDIAENGAVVPITIESKLPKTEWVAVLVEKNPNILAAKFDLTEATDAYIMTRVKMGQTSKVIALVKAGGKMVMTAKEIKVTLGGCGG